MIVLFCPKCGSMVFAKAEKCPKCNEDLTGVSRKKESFTTEAKNTEIIVENENNAYQDKIRIVCPECGYTEATVTVRQTRAADEPETMIYRCCKCAHTWRQY